MDTSNPKTIRILQYAMEFLLCNADEDDASDLEDEGISQEMIENLSSWLDNKVEENRM
jgi:hypothetical protein